MKTKDDVKLEIKKDKEQTVSIYVTPKDFLPDAVYDVMVVRFVNLCQERSFCNDPKLFQNQAEIEFDDKHYLRLGRISVGNTRSLKLEISRMKEKDADGVEKPASKPHPGVCKEVLDVLKQHLDEVYPSKRIMGYALKILCLVCSDREEPHFQELEKCLMNENISCDKTGEKIAMSTAKVQKLFAAGRHASSAASRLHSPSISGTQHTSLDTPPTFSELSSKKFGELKSVVSNWYDSHKSLPMLKVLFRDKVNNQELSQVNGTMDLLNILLTRGDLSPRKLKLLRDTITVTEHFGLLSEIKEKLPSFPDIKEGTPLKTFTIHRQNLMKFGMLLTPADVKKIDGFYNNPCKDYTDSWSMIIDLEDRLIINEGNIKEFIDSLKTLNLSLALTALK